MSLTAKARAVGLSSPNPNSTLSSYSPSSMALSYPPSSLALESLRIPRARRRLSLAPPRGLALGLLPVRPQCFRDRPLPIFSFSASHEESEPSDIDVEKEKTAIKEGAEQSQEAWRETLATFKEQALKMQSVSQEAYEVYSKKAMVVLKETSETLKIQAEKARQEMSVIAKEISEESKEYLSNAAENSPESVKDIVEIFASSTDELNDVSKVRDFYLGIPYGALLSVGGFLSFMLTGNISAIRFGVILGGTLLALSISSLRSWRKGESSSLALKGQAAISTILFLREVRLLLLRPFVANYFTTFVSGLMAAFYIYRFLTDNEQAKGSNLQRGTEN